ncbi:unnamed protein product, partial [Rotaria magnacalcarata]
MCDGTRDCTDGSDEDIRYCDTVCTSDQVRCSNSSTGQICISKLSLCNGMWDCADGSDEDLNHC